MRVYIYAYHMLHYHALTLFPFSIIAHFISNMPTCSSFIFGAASLYAAKEARAPRLRMMQYYASESVYFALRGATRAYSCAMAMREADAERQLPRKERARRPRAALRRRRRA